jgi:hypothetical protein
MLRFARFVVLMAIAAEFAATALTMTGYFAAILAAGAGAAGLLALD